MPSLGSASGVLMSKHRQCKSSRRGSRDWCMLIRDARHDCLTKPGGEDDKDEKKSYAASAKHQVSPERWVCGVDSKILGKRGVARVGEVLGNQAFIVNQHGMGTLGCTGSRFF